MNGPYSLVLTSITLAIVAGITKFFYLWRKPKTINYLFILILLSILPVISIFRPGSYESGDLNAHVTFAISFFRALTDGSLAPRWGMDLNYTYGYPAFLFIYLLPYYLIGLLHAVGFQFLLGTKLILALSFVGSGITMYYFAKSELGKLGGLIAAIFYLYAPYHLVDLHFRVDIGEIVAFVFLPLLLLGIKRMYSLHSLKNFLFTTTVFAALILSHPALSLATIPLVVVYIFYLSKSLDTNKREPVSFVLLSLITGVFLTAFYWFPILVEGKFTSASIHGHQMIFPGFLSFIFSPYRWGFLFQGHNGELSFVIGYVQLLILIATPFLLWKKVIPQKQRLLVVLLLIIVATYFCIMLEVAKPLWYIIPFIKNFQFSYRLLGVVIFCIALIAGAIIPKITNKKILVIILVFTILSTILNWGNRKNVPSIDEHYLLSNVAQSDKNFAVMGQAIPVWADRGTERPWMTSFPKSHLEVILGKAEITEKQRLTTKHIYLVQTTSPTILQENTWYFPGWKVFDNGKEIPIVITKGTNPGLMRFVLLEGTHTVSVEFTDTWDRKIGNTTSLITISILAAILLSSLFFFSQKAYSVKKKK